MEISVSHYFVHQDLSISNTKFILKTFQLLQNHFCMLDLNSPTSQNPSFLQRGSAVSHSLVLVLSSCAKAFLMHYRDVTGWVKVFQSYVLLRTV